jgi:DNA-binding HxlR family transcriptional regulator
MPEKKREQLLIALKEGPKRFTDLLRISGLSNMGLTKALRDFVEEGLVAKLPSGEYVLTEKGKAAVAKMALSELLEKLILEKGAEAVEEELRLLREVDELERHLSLQYLYAAAALLENATGDHPFLHSRASYLRHLIESHIKRWEFTFQSARELLSKLEPLQSYKDRPRPEKPPRSYRVWPPTPPPETLRLEMAVKMRKAEQAERVRNAEQALQQVKLDALTEAERKVALELSSLYEEIKKRLEPL